MATTLVPNLFLTRNDFLAHRNWDKYLWLLKIATGQLAAAGVTN